MSSDEIRRQSREPPDLLTKEAADWIYVGELTAQLGAHAGCVVRQHIQRLSGRDDDWAMCGWIAIFNKVAILLRTEANQARH